MYRNRYTNSAINKYHTFFRFNIINPLLLFLFFTSLLACTDSTAQQKQTNKAPSSVKVLPDLPPIYTNFDDLAPIFQQKTDTTYLINFWATWCAPCVKELPYIEALNKKYAAKKVKVTLVSLDFENQLETKLKPFLKEKKLNSEVVVLLDPDANTWVNEVNPDWSGAIPATMIYKGNEKAFYERSFESLEEIETLLLPFLE
jgi:thiol-disulfide isomerase/thioredoxin